MTLSAIRIWHVIPVTGLIGAAVLAFGSSPWLAYAVFVGAGLVFTAEDFWQPDLARPRYLGNPVLILIIILSAWPARLVLAWRYAVAILPHRFFPSQGVGSEFQGFATLRDALACGIEEVERGDHVFVFDRLVPELDGGHLGQKMYVFEIDSNGKAKKVSEEASVWWAKARYTFRFLVGVLFLAFMVWLVIVAFTRTENLLIRGLAILLIAVPALMMIRSMPGEIRALVLVWLSDHPEELEDRLAEVRFRNRGL